MPLSFVTSPSVTPFCALSFFPFVPPLFPFFSSWHTSHSALTSQHPFPHSQTPVLPLPSLLHTLSLYSASHACSHHTQHHPHAMSFSLLSSPPISSSYHLSVSLILL